jgi:proline iminopeptidase
MDARVDAPHTEGMLEVGDGQSLHWEVGGDLTGTPAVALHGGPGTGTSAAVRLSSI